MSLKNRPVQWHCEIPHGPAPLVLRCRYLPHPSPRAVAPACHCCPVGMAGESSPCWHIPQWKRTGSWLREDEVSCPYLPISENHIFPFVKLLKQAGFLQLKPVVFPQRLSASLCPTWTVRCICGMISFCTTRDRNSRNRAEFTPSPPPQCSG